MFKPIPYHIAWLLLVFFATSSFPSAITFKTGNADVLVETYSSNVTILDFTSIPSDIGNEDQVFISITITDKTTGSVTRMPIFLTDLRRYLNDKKVRSLSSNIQERNVSLFKSLFIDYNVQSLTN